MKESLRHLTDKDVLRMDMSKYSKYEEAVKTLEGMGYVLNIWHISDVTDNYRCSDSEARDILESILESDHRNNRVFEDIDEKAFDNDFKSWCEVYGDEI